MNDQSRSQGVLRKLLSLRPSADLQESPNALIEKFLRPESQPKVRVLKKPGRPPVEEHLKARNFTLCLAHRYLEFLDRMVVKDPKVKGRGRKIRFIIDRFIEHERRQLHQMKVIRNSLIEVDKVLKGFSLKVVKGQKLELTTKEKQQVSQVVDQVEAVTKLLGYTAKELQRLLPRHEWAVFSFCLNWKSNRRTVA